MLFSLVISLCVILTNGAPLFNDKCMQITGDYITESSPGSHDFALKLLDYKNDSVKNLCSGVSGNISINVGQCDKDSLCILFYNRHGNYGDLVNNLSKTFRHRIRYTCIDKRKMCINIKIMNNLSTNINPSYRLKRYISSTADDNEINGRPLFASNWIIILFTVAVSLLLLSMTIMLCVKSTPSEVNLKQSTGLKIIDGPPPEYLASRNKSNSIVVTETHNTANDTMTQEAKIRLNQVSPSTISDDRQDSTSPSEDVPKPKKTQDPLPPTPVVKEQRDEESSEEENPYDTAEAHRKDRTDNNGDDNILSPPAVGGLGSYAKVSRHSGNQGNGYAEVSQVRHAPIGRLRSSTEPVEPLPPLPPITKARTMSGNETSHMPLPHPPTEMEEKPYDSIGNEVLKTIMNEEKVYDSLDNDDDNEMYESVPENLKEELINQSAAPLPGPRSPKDTIELFSGSPSPSKHSTDICPDSPTSKKALKKAAKKKINSNEDDTHRSKISLLNRFRSNSTSAGLGKTKKEKSSLLSPDHSHLTQPIPPPPIPNSGSFDEDDDDNDMYDSVDQAQILDIKLRSGSLPVGMRSSMLFNPRIAEPLPEVPEDSGSGSKGVLVMRDRHTEKDDPNYDIVVRPIEGDETNEEDDEEDTYDTVRPREERPSNINQQQSPPAHSYAKVTGHNTMNQGGSIDHDDKGYALVDPDIIMRKRAASLTKQKSEDMQCSMDDVEPPYDRVIKLDGEDESPYDEVKKDILNNEPPYDSVNIVEKKLETETEIGETNESPYDSVGKVEEESSYDKAGDIGDEPPYDKVEKVEEEPSYDKAGDIKDEPLYDRVEKGDLNPNTNSDDPGYATVITTATTAATTTTNSAPLENETKQEEGSSSPLTFDFTTETVTVEDVTYSHVDLAKKHKERKLKEQQLLNSIEAANTSESEETACKEDDNHNESPVENGSDIQPPPIPVYVIDSSGTVSPDDPSYDVIGPGIIKLTNENTNMKSVSQNGQDGELQNEDTLTVCEQSMSSPLSEESHIYDTLEEHVQQPEYDKLPPQLAALDSDAHNSQS